jgi:hypothetical protein
VYSLNNLYRLADSDGYDAAVKQMDKIFIDEFTMAKTERRRPRYNRDEMYEYLKFTSTVTNQEDYDNYQKEYNCKLMNVIKQTM